MRRLEPPLSLSLSLYRPRAAACVAVAARRGLGQLGSSWVIGISIVGRIVLALPPLAAHSEFMSICKFTLYVAARFAQEICLAAVVVIVDIPCSC